MSAGHAHGHGEHAHRPVWHYLLIAAFLTVLTLVEIGPLFEWYNLPAPVLIVLSVVKFAVVVALFMHLWDDDKIYSQIFIAPLLGATLMVLVLMQLFWSYAPSPRQDSFPIAERHWINYAGQCNSWVRSHVSNRWYCASPALDRARVTAYNLPVGGAAASGPGIDIAGKSPDEAKAILVEAGKGLYEANCAACHQATGAGIPGAFPPLAGTDFIDDPVKHAQIIVKGLSGPITVKGQAYNGAMTAFGTLKDIEIAAIATYERNAWGNDLGMVTPEQVASVR